MTECEVSVPIEHKVTAHLGKVELLRAPDPSPRYQSDVAPDDARRRDGQETATPGPKAVIAGALWIGEPEKGMAEAVSERFEMLRAGK